MENRPPPPPRDFKWEVSVRSMDEGFCVSIGRGMCSMLSWHRKLSFREMIIFKKFSIFNTVFLQYPKTEEQLKISIRKAQEYCDEMNSEKEKNEAILKKIGVQ
jgi:hypothetical protein